MKRLILLVAAAALVLSACQGAAEVLTEQILEQVDGVENFEIDLDSGEIRIERDDESISIGGGKIPDGFAVPIPDGGDVIVVFTSSDGSTVTLSYPIDRYDELVTFYADWTAGQPGEWNQSTSKLSVGGETIRSSAWAGSTVNEDVSISVIDCFDLNSDGDGYNAACVNVTTG